MSNPPLTFAAPTALDGKAPISITPLAIEGSVLLGEERPGQRKATLGVPLECSNAKQEPRSITRYALSSLRTTREACLSTRVC